MGTHRIPILGIQSMPDTTGSVYWIPAAQVMTNDRWNHMILNFADTSSRIGLYGLFHVPKNFVGAPKLVSAWTAQTTSGNVVWDFDYRAVGGDNSESLDQTGQQRQLTVTDAAPSAVNNKMEVTIDLTAADLAVDDIVQFYFGRDGADASDTMAGAAQLLDLLFQYDDA